MNFNWIDAVILIVIAYYLVRGWETGLVYLGASLLSFLGSLWLTLRLHTAAGNFLTEKIGIPSVWTSVLGFIVVGLVTQATLSEVAGLLLRKLPKKIIESHANRWLGALVSAINGFVIISFVLLIILALPIQGTVKLDIPKSTIGRWLVVAAETYGGEVTSLLQSASSEAAKFLTIAPGSKERIPLDILPKGSSLTIDGVSERRMLELVNEERGKIGIRALILDSQITIVARAHSQDMFEHSYFSHVSPDGRDAADRMLAGGVTFTLAGENLALAPNVETAHLGLMASTDHRRNILDPEFTRVGIGVIDSGLTGKMFTQNFAD